MDNVKAREDVIEETRDRYERAPFDRVPPTFPIARRAGQSAKMRRLNLAIDAGGTAVVEEMLGFTAQSVRVDNNTDRWLRIPAADSFVAPKVIGRVFSLGVGTQSARMTQEAPPSRAAGAVTAGQLAQCVWYEDDQPENSGVQIA